MFADIRVYPPWPPLRNRVFGARKRNPLLGARHDRPSPFLIYHHCWAFLSPDDRQHLGMAYPIMLDYAKLRSSVASESVSSLRAERPVINLDPIDKSRCWRMAAALLRFDFDHGDLIRWLGGEYTNEFRDWEAAFDLVDTVRHHRVPPGYPPVDFDRAYRACTAGVPLAGVFECSRSSTWSRERYDNHPPLANECEAVREKLRAEEQLSFYILLPRFLAYFIFGLHLSPLSFVWRKGKGRACVDSSSIISNTDDGAPNTSIPDPGTPDKDDECPAVHYASAFKRHVTWIWNLRISNPGADILQFADDVHAAFHRMLYHPDIAIVFAFVFQEFLCIPVGTVFGARNSPSWWCIVAEVRAHLAACGDFSDDPALHLADRVELILPPTLREQRLLVCAKADRCHAGVPVSLLGRLHQATFVDDTAQAELRENIRASIHASEQAAYTLLGHPGDNRRPSCLSEEKWRDTASYLMDFLGFEVCTRTMTVRWPVEKRLALKQVIAEKWMALPCRLAPREIASLLGTIRNAAFVAPLGNHLSIRLQQCLNEAISRSRNFNDKRWWYTHIIEVPREALEDVASIYRTLDDNPFHPVWHSYIGYLVDREPTGRIISDASYEGIGGWSPDLLFRWRLSRSDLVHAGFQMKRLNSFSREPDADAEGIHINVLEFVAIIINLWMMIVLSRRRPVQVGGNIFAVFADNTSALSWLRYASRSHRANVRRLARFTSALLFASGFQGKVQGKHLAGRLNRGADALSRCRLFPTWASVTAQCSLLSSCTTFRIPHELLSLLGSMSSDRPTEALSDELMTKLLSLEHNTLRVGSNEMASTTSRSKPSRSSRRSH